VSDRPARGVLGLLTAQAVAFGVTLALLVIPANALFLDAYGAFDDGTRLRAQVLAVFFGALLTEYARAERMPGLERENRAGLARALAG